MVQKNFVILKETKHITNNSFFFLFLFLVKMVMYYEMCLLFLVIKLTKKEEICKFLRQTVHWIKRQYMSKKNINL